MDYRKSSRLGRGRGIEICGIRYGIRRFLREYALYDMGSRCYRKAYLGS